MSSYYILWILLFSLSFSLGAEELERKVYLKNRNRVELFKENMPLYMKEYYLPRKRYIDKQPVSRDAGPYWQVSLILEGSEKRELNRKNKREIRKLEKFLLVADDFQLSRYFSREDAYLKMKAKYAIQEIKELAELDEQWRKQNDPIFTNYLHYKASVPERKFYKRNKSKFFSDQTGEELVILLQKEGKSFTE
jgi:hypothetical protein